MPILDEGGRFQSYRTVEDYKSILLSELKALSPSEREAAILSIQDYLIGSDSALFDLGADDIYRVKPVPMQEWLKNPYYLGSITKTLFPTVKEDLTEIFEGLYSVVIWGGSLGGGKSSASILCCVRMIYEMSCLRNPHEVYGISTSDFISIPCLSVTEETAHRNLIQKISAIVHDSPYFKREFPPVKDTMAAGILFKNKILIPPGSSTASNVIGTNAVGAIIDESNFFQNRLNADTRGQDGKENIDIVFESLQRRIESRFMSKGKLPGIIAIASSKTVPTAFTERTIKKYSNNPKVFVRERSVYEAVPTDRFSGVTFRVAIGNETKSSRLLSDGEPDPEGMKVIKVPVEYYASFESDIEAAIRDISGFFTAAITPFISRREKIHECIDARVHPCSLEIWEQDRPLVIDWDKITKLRSDGSREPLLNPSAPRHIHLDLSKNHDRTGVVVSHVGGYTQVQRIGSDHTEMAPIIVVDFMLAIQAPPRGEIVYAEIRRLIYEFSRHGFYIKLVSADQFQSVSLLQTVKSQGYQTEVVSVDIVGPYDVLKTAIYESRLRMYNYPPLLKELRELQKDWKTGKVDHPPIQQKGSKDISDALCATVATLTKANYHVSDRVLTSDRRDPILNDESWVLDDPGTQVSIDELNDTRPEWRRHGESMLQERGGRSFEMPFVAG